MRIVIPFLCFCSSLILCACGHESSNPCNDAAQLKAEGMSDLCEGQDAPCAFCACIDQGLLLDRASGDCLASSPDADAPCEGSDLSLAELCLLDAEACREDGVDLARMSCQAEYLMVACVDDSECAFELICSEVTGLCSLP